MGRYVEALAAGCPPAREVESLDAETRAVERLMLALRLDEPVVFPRGTAGVHSAVVDADAIERLVQGRLLELVDGSIRLTRRGRLLGDAVTAELIA